MTYAENQSYYIFIRVQAMHISYTWIMAGNHMYSHEILSDSIPLYIYYNCYFYHNLYDHVLSIAHIFVHVIIGHIAINFIIFFTISCIH